MLYMTTDVDDRISQLRVIAAELRHGRTVKPDRRAGWAYRVRLRIGGAFLAVGSALLNGAHPPAPESRRTLTRAI